MKIEEQRTLENQKDLLRHIEYDKDVVNENNEYLPEPMPNQNHHYCQICNENYADFLMHVATENHKKRASVQTDVFKEIDLVFLTLKEEKRWLNDKQEPPVVT